MNKTRKKSRKKSFYTYLIIILIIAFLAFLFSFRAYYHYSVWKSQHDYFNNPNTKIQAWMTVDMVSRGFNIPRAEIIKELNVTEPLNPHMNLDRFCTQYNKNCTILLDRLNNLIGR